MMTGLTPRNKHSLGALCIKKLQNLTSHMTSFLRGGANERNTYNKKKEGLLDCSHLA